MTNNQPITPPPELFKQWEDDILNGRDNVDHVLDCAWRNGFQAGADQELEACVNYVDITMSGNKARALRAARRPKPPSLKEQALAALNVIEDKMLGPTTEEKLIRKALEALPND